MIIHPKLARFLMDFFYNFNVRICLVCRKLILILLLNLSFSYPVQAGLMPKDTGDQYELSYWESVRDSKHAADYEAYLQAYPAGRFVALARTRLERIRGGKAKPAMRGTVRPVEAARRWRRLPEKLPPERQPDIAAAAAATAAITELETAAVPSGSSSAPVSTLEISDCPTCPTLVALAEGGFRMGSNSDDLTARPAFHVFIAKPFAIGKYEITHSQWNACITDGACPRLSADNNRSLNTPVRDVSWEDAQRYTGWLSKLTGLAYRLPTEAEWEYAARGGSTERYWWGSAMKPAMANCKDCGMPWSPENPATVGSFASNSYGLHDMSGSVWEWVSDCWHNSYQRAPANGDSWEEADCRHRVLRGGSWRDGAAHMPVSTRFQGDPTERQAQNGFRIARNLE